ncbi:5'-3' exoribonuclease 2 [Hamiltosporidium tvaerminnensis]|nr:5'-3' exoribonuclease 2 [Hamiltosporidium tvaerminnensis]
MGVPSLFRWLVEKYPDIIEKAPSKEQTDGLYLDFNGIIHNSSKPTAKESPKSENEIFENIFKRTSTMVEIVRPIELLYISIDGVAPRAKLYQQRGRRYRSAIETLESGKRFFAQKRDSNLEAAVQEAMDTVKSADILTEPIETEEIESSKNNMSFEHIKEELLDISSEDQEIFDSNAITPGTDFMENLENKIKKFIQYKISTDELWKGLTVIYNGSYVPGEGEQKIISFIRSQKKLRKNFRHTIYSPDADLIFLGLLLHEKNVKILREDVFYQEKEKKSFCRNCNNKGHSFSNCGSADFKNYLYTFVSVLRRHLETVFKEHIKRSFDCHRIIDDFVFLCFFAGNDFIPTLPCFDIRFEAIEKITQMQINNFQKYGKYLTNKSQVDFETLRTFLVTLAGEEDELYIKKTSYISMLRKKFNQPGIFERISLNTSKGRMLYYKAKMKVTNDSEIQQACRNYIEGLAWVFGYYYSGVKSWDWYYSYHFAPLARDLSRVSGFSPKFNLGKPLRPLEQIMVVIPPMSKNIVPEQLHTIFEDNKDMFPTTVKIDMFDKLLPWQGVVVLPFVNINSILQQVSKKISELNLKDTLRNIEGNEYIFIGDKNIFYTILDEMYTKCKLSADFGQRGFTGRAFPYCYSEFPGEKLTLIEGTEFENHAMCAIYKMEK